MTRTEIKRNFNHIYSVGYCDLQYLLRYQHKIGSNSGVYGWNYNIYSLDNGNIAICTGYRSMPGVAIDHKIIRKYENKAKEIIDKYIYTEHEKRTNALLQKFIKELKTIE